jgi:hypothetical protein
MDVSPSAIRNLRNRALRWNGHIERVNGERLRNNVLHWSPAGTRRRGVSAYKRKAHVNFIIEYRAVGNGDRENSLGVLRKLRMTA